MKRKILKIILIILGVITVIFIVFAIFISRGLNIKDDVIQNIDISKVADGVYQGEYTGNRFANKLEATVTDGKITDIRILKDMMVSVPGVSEGLFDEVIKEQSLQVDAVSGATVSSKAYLKALENALGK